MKVSNFSTSSCRHCQHYEIEGRRGGHCTLLSVPVRGEWSACSLGIPAFTPVTVSVAKMAEAKVSDSQILNNDRLDCLNNQKTLTNPILIRRLVQAPNTIENSLG